ncbi:MAG: penicillin-binding protein 2 [Bosea sp.]|jgi:cell division protein FtsI (penicillin-binding protein 3)|nr:penicillin-binding protein 2 [Bosea sp. (in: a-proteobacteria)]
MTALPGEPPATATATASFAQPRDGAARRSLRFARGLFRMSKDKSEARVGLVILCFGVLFATLSGRLVYLAVAPDEPVGLRRATADATSAARPDIVDRNGEVLATDIRSVSVFAEPRKIIDKDEAVELLTAVLPDIDARDLRDRFERRRGFVWVKREITPRQQAEVHRLGIPGVGFVPENKRVYPNGTAAAHVLGFANIDNIGIAGIEKHIDQKGLTNLKGAGLNAEVRELPPVQLSIDLRVQHALRDELATGMARFKAKAAAGSIIDVNTGEVIATVSLPDFDPANQAQALDPNNINRINVGVFEMGSTFKALTVAMALDSGRININSTFDARNGLRYGRHTINDFHAKRTIMTVPEVFVYSSNIGTARMALQLGVEHHRSFLRRAGQLDRLRTELPESAEPIVPARWGELNTMTIAFGHGLAVAPLQAAMATAALMNGGNLIPPTFLKRNEEQARSVATRLIRPETSEAMRYVMRLNAERGSASRAAVPGFYVGGKTGTAEKVINGRYSKNRLFTTFMAVAPSDKPRYLFMILYDEPQGLPETNGYATSGWNASPTTGRIIERVAPLLGLPPRFEAPERPFPLMARHGAWGTR